MIDRFNVSANSKDLNLQLRSRATGLRRCLKESYKNAWTLIRKIPRTKLWKTLTLTVNEKPSLAR